MTLPSGDEPPESEVPEGDYPFVVQKDDGKEALCVQAFTYTKYLGSLTVNFDDNGEILCSKGNPILLDDSVAKGIIMMQPKHRMMYQR